MRKSIPNKLILLLGGILVSSTLSLAQPGPNPADPLAQLNQQLRTLFTPLARPNPSKLFLYDMSAHVVDEEFFAPVVANDVSNMDNWFMLYEEMKNAAYDPAPLSDPENILTAGLQFDPGTVPLVIMDWDMYRLKDDALTTNIYFNWDVTNTILSDKQPRPGFPFDEDHVFSAAPITMGVKYANVVFRIDPAFYFTDQFSQAEQNEKHWQFKVDFGDGNGWKSIDPTILSNHNVTYPSAGDKVLKVAWFDGSNIMRLSKSSLRVASIQEPLSPDFAISVEGVNAEVFPACNNTSIYDLGKVVLYLEGYDALDIFPGLNRTTTDIYNDQIKKEELATLRNFGYDIVVVDWDNSGVDIRKNAEYLIKLIERIKCMMSSDQQIVIMGESMGGLIARHALLTMEASRFGTGPCYPEKRHNTRLLITVDTPHQGANVPLSLQHLYRDGTNLLKKVVPISSFLLGNVFNAFLDGRAAQQMLRYHVDTHIPGAAYSPYSQHQKSTEFFTELKDMGNYPKMCKLVALSNGSMAGFRQTRAYDGVQRLPNDYLLKFDSKIYARVLGIRINVWGGNLHLRTNPNGAGQLYELGFGTWDFKIKLKFFGVKIKVGLNSLIEREEFGANLISYGTAPGGYQGNYNLLPGGGTNINCFVFSVNTNNNGSGLYSFQSSVGIPFLANGNLDFSIYSDGFHFGFVPTISALDIQNPNPFINIESSTAQIILQNTPFDMISGFAASEEVVGETVNRYNHNHLVVRNPYINEVNQSSSNRYYRSCATTSQTYIPRTMLPLEIGDEELYLENQDLYWKGRYEVEFDLYVNTRNPYYTYVGQPFQANTHMIPTTYSRKDPFTITPSGFAVLKFDATSSLSMSGLLYAPPESNLVQKIDEPLEVCCIEEFEPSSRLFVPLGPLPVETAGKFQMEMYPNPADHSVSVWYTAQGEQAIQLQLTDLLGKVVAKQVLPTVGADGSNTVTLDVSMLPAGIYLLNTIQGANSTTQKLIVN